MRWTRLETRRARTLWALALVCAMGAGCQRIPYLDHKKDVPHDPFALIDEEEAEVRQAAFFSELPMQLPDVTPPRTTNNPEAEEIWPLTLEEAMRIGLENSEVVRIIPLGAQGIPLAGFEPAPLSQGGAVGITTALGAATLSTVYDPAIQETQIAQALSVFDANLSTSLFWGRNVQPVNNAIVAGVFAADLRFPVIFDQNSAQFNVALQKRVATGAIFQVANNINWLFTNSPINVWPSAYTTNTQFLFRQPLLGGTPENPSGLEANRAPVVIARLNADVAVWSFKASVMAHVRSIEQQYWALAQAHVQLWSREYAVALGEEIVRREQNELEVGRGTIADLSEAQQQLERFRLELVTATADVITIERQLRNLLGLRPTDNRRIVPVTAPTEAPVEPNWEASLAQMLSFQPDIVQQQLFIRLAELQLLIARNQLLPLLNLDVLYQLNGLGRTLDRSMAVMTGATLRAIDPLVAVQQQAAGLQVQPGEFRNFETWQVGFTFDMPIGFRGPLANVRAAQYALLRQRAYMQQVVHQTSHSLQRFFLEVDVNYKQFRTASRLRAAAAQRLEAQRSEYEEGRITIDRYLEAVSEWANAVALEAQFKNSYNTSIAALEEAKGTLLAYNNIAVAEGPYPPQAYIQAQDQIRAHRQLHVPPDGPLHPDPINGPPVADSLAPVPTPDRLPAGPVPPLPAPAGPLGPHPRPSAPAVPAGEPTILSDQPSPTDLPALPEFAPTPSHPRPGDDPLLFTASPAANDGQVVPVAAEAALEEPIGELAPIDLPPLPPQEQ